MASTLGLQLADSALGMAVGFILTLYLAATVLYLVTTGVCAARSVALIMEIVGPEARDPSTLYSLLNTPNSTAIVYVV